MTTWCMHIACWIPKSPNTHSEYVIIISFPLQQWLHERAPKLRYSALPVFFFLMLTHCFLWDRFFSTIYGYMNFRLPPAKARIQSQVNVCEISWNWQKFLSGEFGFSLTVSLEQCSILIHWFWSYCCEKKGVRSLVTCDHCGTLCDIGIALTSKTLPRCRLFVLQISCG
jgi:hypothetical protein